MSELSNDFINLLNAIGYYQFTQNNQTIKTPEQ